MSAAPVVPAGPSLQPTSTTDAAVGQLLASVRDALQAHLNKPADADTLKRFQSVRADAARQIATLGRKALATPAGAAVRALVREVTKSGVLDTPADADTLSLASTLYTSMPNAGGLLAAMLLVAPWQWPQTPDFVQVPDALWADVAAWIFTPPQGFTAPGQAEHYAKRLLHHLEDLSRWVDRNAASATVRSALEVYVNVASSIPLYFSADSLRRHAELRGRLLSRAISAQRDTYAPIAESRYGRRLRVGFVNRHFGPQTETYTTLPTFEQLDPDRFEVYLFAHRVTDTPLETHCRQRAYAFQQLPESLNDQLTTLRAAQLDVLVFGTNLTAVFNEVTRLALHRIAPLQVVNNSSCITSGLPHVDLYVSGSLTEVLEASAHFTERLGLLPGPAHAFNYEADRQEPTTSWTRAALGVPEEGTLFVTAANYFKIIPEMQQAWARLLAETPGSYLLVHPFNPNWSSSYPIDRFCTEFDRVLTAHGVSNERVRISTEKFPSRSDVKSLLGVGDVYLDTFPFGGVNSLIDPLELGIPTVTWEGATFRSRMGAALLRQLELPSLIATTEQDYLAIARRLGTDVAAREQVRDDILRRMERTPVFLDSLAASDQFGDLLELAYDQVVDQGLEAFRKEPTPLTVALPSPVDSAGRHARGLELLSTGRTDRAIEYLTAAVLQDEGNAVLWYDIASAYRTAGQYQAAIETLETSLRLDALRADGWVMLVELADGVGSTELAREALGCAMEIAPHDLRVMELAARHAA